MDVKYVPTACYVGELPDRFYQYTVIDEASRERFIVAACAFVADLFPARQFNHALRHLRQMHYRLLG